jgi:hypothetical protein
MIQKTLRKQKCAFRASKAPSSRRPCTSPSLPHLSMAALIILSAFVCVCVCVCVCVSVRAFVHSYLRIYVLTYIRACILKKTCIGSPRHEQLSNGDSRGESTFRTDTDRQLDTDRQTDIDRQRRIRTDARTDSDRQADTQTHTTFTPAARASQHWGAGRQARRRSPLPLPSTPVPS